MPAMSAILEDTIDQLGVLVAMVSAHVFSLCDRFKMRWIHAAVHPAKVIDNEAVRDRPQDVLVSKSMSEYPLVGGERKDAIAPFVSQSGPEPASIGFAYSRPESRARISLDVDAGCYQRISMMSPTIPMSSTPSASTHRVRTAFNRTWDVGMLAGHRYLLSAGVTRPDVAASRPHFMPSILPLGGI